MLRIIKEKGRLNETLFLGILSVLCFCFSLFRLHYTGTKVFLFLNWNLFLAFVPWMLTSITIIKPKLQESKLALLLISGIWLLFFPNAPYILTDLFHLKWQSSMPIWFDLILILSFAWTGLLFGFFSLLDLEKMMQRWIDARIVTAISIVLMFVGSFGIYLGRYLRWNSWDILTEPFSLLYDIGDRVINPFSHKGTWGMTLFMGIFLNMIYLSFKLIRKREGTVSKF